MGITNIRDSFTNVTGDRVMFAQDPFGNTGYNVTTKVLQGGNNNWYADMVFTPTPNLSWYKINAR
mgnify:FL=1